MSNLSRALSATLVALQAPVIVSIAATMNSNPKTATVSLFVSTLVIAGNLFLLTKPKSE